jgi:hypothetical protein
METSAFYSERAARALCRSLPAGILAGLFVQDRATTEIAPIFVIRNIGDEMREG